MQIVFSKSLHPISVFMQNTASGAASTSKGAWCSTGESEVRHLKDMVMEIIGSPKFFPAVLILLDVGAAVMYLQKRDWRKVIYWLAAAVLNAAVTF